jgi:hypothetical protein
MAERIRAFDLRAEGNRMDTLFHFICFHLFVIFMCNLFSTYFSILSTFFSAIDFLKFQNRLVQCLAHLM